jgi:riboflavin synthase alpha subunit
MFTGIVERTAEVEGLEVRAGGRVIRLRVREVAAFGPWRPVSLGESISVNGVCLTAVDSESTPVGGWVSFEAVPETLAKTTLGDLRVGDLVNVERSLRVGDILGGHFVSGHVDGTGVVRARRRQGDQVLFEVSAAAEMLRCMLPKGSIAVDGISLTVVGVDRAAGWFSVAAIPHTLERTALSRREVGSRVNLETDLLGKWVLRGLEERIGGSEGRLGDLLRSAGFVEERS